MNKTMNKKLNKKELKRNVITVLDTVIFIILLVFSSCSNNAQQDITSSETPYVITQEPEQNQEQGIATVRMFIPDYYALAEQSSDRAIAPQTKKVRLSYRINDSWIGINSIDLSTATKTPVENAPDGFTGSVYTCTFDGVPVGTYTIDNLKIDLLDNKGNTITSGKNTTSVTITKGGSAGTTFYTIPVSTEPNVGNLAAGEMKFSLEYLYTDIKYKVSMKTSGDYPDIVLFSNDGRLMNYYAIDSAEDEAQIEVPVSGQYYIGVWADDGNKIGRYEYSLGKIEFITKQLYGGIHYSIDLISSGSYPDVVLFKEGELIHYYTISNEEEAHITLTVQDSGSYTFVIYGNETDNYNLMIDDLKLYDANLVQGINYDIKITTTEDYPDLALIKFSSYGAEGELLDYQLVNYWSIADEEGCYRRISVDESGLYAFALIGMKLDKYTFTMDNLKFIDVNLIAGINYDIKITTTEDYPDLALLKFAGYGAEGGYIDYQVINSWDIKNENDCARTISVDKSGYYLFALIGMNLDSYGIKFDLTKGTQLSGVLTGENLIWTKEKSPYFVNGNILVEAGRELSIEPGVIIEFTDYNFYLRVDGSISAVGANDEPIIFMSSGNNISNWTGIIINGDSNLLTDNNEYRAGNIIKNCMIMGANTPLSLNSSVYVDSCTFAVDSGYISVRSDSVLINNTIESGITCNNGGNIMNNDIQGNIDCDEHFHGTIKGNEIKGSLYCGSNFSGTIIENDLKGGINYGYYYNGIIINNVIHGGINYSRRDSGCNGSIINNDIIGSVSINGNITVKNNTFSDGSISFYNFSGTFISNIMNKCPIYISSLNGKINGNNFIGYEGTIFDVSYTSNGVYDFTGNYWGESQTSELNELGNKANISFFNDYYENFEWTKIDYSNWATEPIEGTGYLGDGFITFDYTINGYAFVYQNYADGPSMDPYPERTSPELTIAITPQYHVNDISFVRIAQSLTRLKETEWSTYDATQVFTVDKTILTDGIATVYVQLKDSKENISSPLMHEVPFDNPVINMSVTDGASYSTATSSLVLNYGATDNGNLIRYELYIDGEMVKSEEAYDYGWNTYGWGRTYSNSYTLGLTYMSAGEHRIKAIFWDIAGNSTTKTVNFTINRTVNSSSFASSFDSTTGQLLKDSKTVYLWHFDENGNEAGNNSSATIGSYDLGTGGLGGYTSYVHTEDSIDVSFESAFSVECWHKGNDYFGINKDSVFGFYTSDGYSYYKTASGSVNNNYFNWSSISDDNWHFYSFVYNGSYTAIYRDGVLLRYIDGFSQTLNTNDNKLYIDAYNIDELRISNVARSADEIAAYYNAAKSHIVSE